MSDLFKILFSSIAGPLLLFAGLFIMYKTFNLLGVELGPIVSVALALTPVWLPFTLFYLTHEAWMYYVRMKFQVNNGRSLLRIHLPQDVFKSPEAMESVFSQVHNANNPDNLMQAYLDGKHPLTYSFELVSIGGEVRFYLNVPTKKVKNAIEAQLYAQYPGIEVTEEQFDYVDEIVWDPEKYEMMAFHVCKKEDEVYPIKTYIDFGLDKMPKEEEKFEPMAAMIEQLGKAKPYERFWIQILAIPHTKKNFKTGSIYNRPTWEKKVEDTINLIMNRNSKVTTDEDGERQLVLTMGEKEKIAAMERNVGKYAYETAIRWMYIAETGKFNGDSIGPIVRTFSQYDILNRNSLGVRWRTDFDYNFISDYSGKKKERLKKEEFYEYKLREYTMRDKVNKADAMKVMSTEELATIFHIPGKAVVTPSLPRIMSTRKEAPSNLPTGEAVGF